MDQQLINYVERHLSMDEDAMHISMLARAQGMEVYGLEEGKKKKDRYGMSVVVARP